MPITIPAVGRATLESLIAAIINQLNSSNVSLIDDENNGVPNLINGSFETYAEVLSVNVPINWTQTLLTGGSYLLDTSVFGHGVASVRFTAPGGSGNGGGYIQSTDLLPISPFLSYGLQGIVKSDVSGMINRVRLYWFNSAGNACSTPYTEIWNSTTTPSTFTSFKGVTYPPNNGIGNVNTAAFVQVRLIGGDVSSPSGNTWFDGVQFYDPYGDITYLNLSSNMPYANLVINVDTNVVVTLPPIGSNGRPVKIVVFNNNTGVTLIVDPSAGNTILGTSSYSLTNNTGVEFISDGLSNWVAI